jgi:two-component system phosphate regulon response regulator PhoB
LQKLLFFTHDQNLGQQVSRTLEDAGYRVFNVSDPEKAVDLFYSERPEMLVFDLASFEESKIKELKHLRREERMKELPVLVLIQKDALENLTLSLGIDDFLFREADPLELKVRIQQIFWRLGKVDQENTVNIGELLLDLNNYQVSLKGKPISLTYREYELLKFFILNKDRVFTREVLLDRVWGYDNYVGTRTVDIHVQRLRTKLGSTYGDLIQTTRNVGYKFSSELDNQ